MVVLALLAAACAGERPPPPEPAATPTASALPEPEPTPARTGADDGAAVTAERRVDGRTLDLTIDSPALGGPGKVRLLLPRGWAKDARRTWPVLWLLHGGFDDHTSWTAKTSVESITAKAGVIVVMPDGGRCGSYSNWWNHGRGGAPRWETFHLDEVRQILERGYRAGTGRAIAGYSMGGQGAMLYAARRPGMFRAAASFSGAVHILYDNPRGLDPSVVIAGGTSLACPGTDWKRIWGDPRDPEQRRIWAEHNPYDVAAGLRDVRLYVAAGTGRPERGGLPIGDAVEELAYGVAQEFVKRLYELDIPVKTHFYPGRHTHRYWERELRAALPGMLEAMR
ncbi:esterase family protein [Bailinhaonella thermotolerans]|uniref:Esterase family protein n=1 Tax=Bailinhaonella thermotolerans TaxID=1070861 RepID=A0A3A4B338_9ACTN|nr:esterase family protein [Bailinhaonella thermotolerans]